MPQVVHPQTRQAQFLLRSVENPRAEVRVPEDTTTGSGEDQIIGALASGRRRQWVRQERRERDRPLFVSLGSTEDHASPDLRRSLNNRQTAAREVYSANTERSRFTPANSRVCQNAHKRSVRLAGNRQLVDLTMRQIDHVRAGSPWQSDPFGRVLRNPAVLHCMILP